MEIPLGEAMVSALAPTGKLSTKAELRVNAEPLALPKVSVKILVPVAAMLLGEKAWVTVGNCRTTRVALAPVVLVTP